MEYFSLYKTAAAKDKIRKYKITDKYQQLFIHKFENEINWTDFDRRVKEGDETTVILNDLIDEKINDLIDQVSIENPENKFFFTPEEIDVEQELNDNAAHPQIQQARNIYRQDPNGAKKQIADILNKSKDSVITAWLEYVLEQNDVYKQNSAFQYIILHDIFESAKKPSKSAPLSLNAEVLAGVYTEIVGDSNVNLAKIYDKNLKRNYFKSSETVTTSERDGWIRIPSGENDPTNYEENEAKLRDLSQGTGWCTGRGMEKDYLPQGDFWLLIENGKAVVAIRFVRTSVVEIQGKFNVRPHKYFQQVERLFDEKQFDKNNQHYTELLEVKENNRKFEENDVEFINTFIKDVEKDPFKANRLDKKYWNDAIKSACISGYINRIQAFINSGCVKPEDFVRDYNIEQSPDFVASNMEVQKIFLEAAIKTLNRSVFYYELFPESVQKNADFKQAVLERYLSAIKHNLFNYEDAPDYVKESEEIKDIALMGWKDYIIEVIGKRSYSEYDDYSTYTFDDQYDYEGIKIPGVFLEKLKKDKDLEKKIIDKTIELFSRNEDPLILYTIPPYIRKNIEIMNAYKQSIKAKLIIDPYFDNEREIYMPEEFENDIEIEKARIIGLANSIRQDPYYWDLLVIRHPHLQNEPSIINSLIDSYINRIKMHNNNPCRINIDNAPSFVQNNTNVQNTYIDVFKNYLSKSDSSSRALSDMDLLGLVRCAPDYVRADPTIKRLFDINFIKTIKQYPEVFKNAPKHLQDDPSFQQLHRSSWIKYIKNHPFQLPNVPDDLRDLPEMQQAIKDGFAQVVLYNPYHINMVPEDISNTPQIRNAYIRGLARMYVNYGGDPIKDMVSYTHPIPDDIKSTEEFKIYVLSSYIDSAYKWARLVQEDSGVPDYVRNNEAFKNAIKKHIISDLMGLWWHTTLSKIPDDYLTDHEFMQRIYETVLHHSKNSAERLVYYVREDKSKISILFKRKLIHDIVVYSLFENKKYNIPYEITSLPEYGEILNEVESRGLSQNSNNESNKNACGWYNISKISEFMNW